MNLTQSLRTNEDRTCRFRRITGKGFCVAIEITRRCNLRCKHCFVPVDNNKISLAKIEEVIDQLAKIGVRKIILTGGEPLLRNDLEEIIQLIVAKDILADLNSNFYNLTKERAKELFNAGLEEASVSLYGGEVYHDELTKQNGAFKNALKGMDYFRELNISIDVHGAIWDDMIPDINNLLEKVVEHGGNSLTFYSILKTEDWFNYNGYKLTLKLAFETLEKLRSDSPIPIRTVGLMGFHDDECVMGNSIFGISSDFKLLPCLLSNRLSGTGLDLNKMSIKNALAEIDTQLNENIWCPSCYNERKNQK